MDIFDMYVMSYVTIKLYNVSYHKEIARRQKHSSRSNGTSIHSTRVTKDFGAYIRGVVDWTL